MKIIKEEPSYYKDYQCTGNTTCTYICCFARDLPMDKETLELYQKEEGEFGERLRENIFQDKKSGVWYIKPKEDGCCPFLTEEKLCDVRLHMGEHAQINICEIYPRERDIRVGNYRLNRLLIACPEVGRLLYKETDGPLKFVREYEESDEKIPAELLEKTRLLIAFRDGFVDSIEKGSYDRILFEEECDSKGLKRIMDEALFFEGHEPSDRLFREVKKILPLSAELKRKKKKKTPEAKTWIRRTAAYFAHRMLLDAVEDGSLDGPIMQVFRSVKMLELMCIAFFHSKGSFDADDMIECGRLFGLNFELSMHNFALFKEKLDSVKDVYPDNENSEIRPYLYP